LGFGCDELVRIRNSHRTKEVGRQIGLSANQKLSGKLLLKRRRRRNLRFELRKGDLGFGSRRRFRRIEERE
jgi:hypothetical protein